MSKKYKIKKSKYDKLREDMDALRGWPKGLYLARTETELPPYEECFQDETDNDVLLTVKRREYTEEEQALFDPADEISDEEHKEAKEKAKKEKAPKAPKAKK